MRSWADTWTQYWAWGFAFLRVKVVASMGPTWREKGRQASARRRWEGPQCTGESAVSSNSQPASKVWGGVTQLSVSRPAPAPPPSRPRPSRAPHLAEVRGSPAPVAESVLEREEFREGPGGRGMPEHLQTPPLCAQAHAFRRVGLDWWKQDRVRVGSSGSFLHL